MRKHSLRNMLSAFIALTLFQIPIAGYSASALWIAESKGVIKVATADGAILFEIPDAKGIDSVAIDDASSRVWTYGDQRLKAYSANGVLEISRHIPNLPRKTKAVDMLADSTGLWLAIDKELFRFDSQAVLQKTLRFKQPIRTLTLDTKRDWLWVAAPGRVFILDSAGRDLKQFYTHFINIEQLEYDSHLDQTWVVVDPFVLRLDSRTLHLKSISKFGIGYKLRAHASADGQGGLWGADGKQVSHLGVDGDVDVSFRPFSGKSAQLQDLVADSDDGSVWLANRTTLKQYNLAGAQLKEFVPDLGDGIIRSINRMVLSEPSGEAPVLTIASPTSGGFINSNRPTLELEYTSSGTIDTESIEIKHNDVLLNADCTGDQTQAECFINTVLDEGEMTLSATIANDDGKHSEPATVTFTVDTLAPVIVITVPRDGLLTNNAALTLEGNVDEPLDSLTLTHNGSVSTLSLNNNNFSRSITLSEGANTLTVSAIDFAGNPDSQTVNVLLDTIVPEIPDIGLISVGLPVNGTVTVTGQPGSVEPNSRVTITNTQTGQSTTVTANADGSFSATLAAGNGDVLRITIADSVGNTSEPADVDVLRLPPDPASVAPPVSNNEITTFSDAFAFLYTGDNPIQLGVLEETIDPVRIAVIRGKVLDRQNRPLSGVLISIHGHPEFGSTLSRADGMFDMAVNGGGLLTINYEKDDYLRVQREVDAPWRGFAIADDVVMIQLDPDVTTIDLNNPAPYQIARGSAQTDADGTRRATILFPQGTTALMTLPDGSLQTLTTLNIRATEYTVGENGQQAMPAMLPPTSAYTYAVELSADEALAAGASHIQFNQPVSFYVENFLNFPVGEEVPVGFYDFDPASWIPDDNGKVIRILAIENGLAVLDVTGSGEVATPVQLMELGISTAEQQQLAGLYTAGASLWRVPLTHFSPIDCNFPQRPENTPPETRKPKTKETDKDGDDRDKDDCEGCIITPQGQTLGETVLLTGIPHTLNYRSNRMPGYVADRTVNIILTTNRVSSSLLKNGKFVS